MRVRDAMPEDAEAIAAVHVRTWQGAYSHIFPTDRLAGISVDARAQFWRRLLTDPPPRTYQLVAEDEAGTSRLRGRRTGRGEALAEVYAIYVLPEAWGLGHGRALIAGLLDRLRRAGFREAILWVFADNPRTRRFYEQGDWRLDGEPVEQTHLDTSVSVVSYRIAL